MTQDKALPRLLKKLSALRTTLNKDERTILDRMVTGAADEVVAHRMDGPISPIHTEAAAEVVAHKMNVDRVTEIKQEAASEVVAHRFNMDKAAEISQEAAAEVVAHQMNVGRVTEIKQERIVYDEKKNEYRLI